MIFQRFRSAFFAASGFIILALCVSVFAATDGADSALPRDLNNQYPANADRLSTTIVDMIKSLAETGPTEEELATAKKQIANALEIQLEDPAFWIHQLGELNYHRHNLEELEDVPGVFQTYTCKQIQDTLKKYVTDQNEIRLCAIPRPPEAIAPATQRVVHAEGESK